MKPRCVVTTSWDDGHPSDLRIAELLSRYSIPGTFYVPQSSQFARMGERDVRELAQGFEIAAHTLRHLPLTQLSDGEASQEIVGSKDYVEQLVGSPCTMFAPPGGRFNRLHLQLAEKAGFQGFRTTELMSLRAPARRGEIAVMPTTLQLFPHRQLTYWKNALRRTNLLNLFVYLRHARKRSLIAAFESLLSAAIESGGVLHLWGHGWEIEQRTDWSLLEAILQKIAERRNEVHLVSNGELSNEYLTFPLPHPLLP